MHLWAFELNHYTLVVLKKDRTNYPNHGVNKIEIMKTEIKLKMMPVVMAGYGGGNI